MKLFKHTTRAGKEVVIKLWKKNNEVCVEVVGDDIEHKYPHCSRIKDNTLYADGLYTKQGKKKVQVSGIMNLSDEIVDYYNLLKDEIAKEKREKRKREIENDKKVETVEFTDHTTYGFNTGNMFLQSLGFNNLSNKEREEVLKISTMIDCYMGDYSIETTYKAKMSDIVKAIEKIKVERKKKKQQSIKKEIANLKERIENKDVPYENMQLIDVDLSTGIPYYTFTKRVDLREFNKVRHLFEFIESGKDDVDFMYGTKFKGYATRSPEKVCEILYPNWIEDGMQKLQEKLGEILKGENNDNRAV